MNYHACVCSMIGYLALSSSHKHLSSAQWVRPMISYRFTLTVHFRISKRTHSDWLSPSPMSWCTYVALTFQKHAQTWSTIFQTCSLKLWPTYSIHCGDNNNQSTTFSRVGVCHVPHFLNSQIISIQKPIILAYVVSWHSLSSVWRTLGSSIQVCVCVYNHHPITHIHPLTVRCQIFETCFYKASAYSSSITNTFASWNRSLSCQLCLSEYLIQSCGLEPRLSSPPCIKFFVCVYVCVCVSRVS